MSREVIVILVAQWQTYKLGLNYYIICTIKIVLQNQPKERITEKENWGK
jgi:hypothetical protein